MTARHMPNIRGFRPMRLFAAPGFRMLVLMVAVIGVGLFRASIGESVAVRERALLALFVWALATSDWVRTILNARRVLRSARRDSRETPGDETIDELTAGFHSDLYQAPLIVLAAATLMDWFEPRAGSMSLMAVFVFLWSQGGGDSLRRSLRAAVKSDTPGRPMAQAWFLSAMTILGVWQLYWGSLDFAIVALIVSIYGTRQVDAMERGNRLEVEPAVNPALVTRWSAN